ncbi:hypothetical protein [Maritimibacter sp. HL-12]|jgi:hypothetical protein|uniref:hypothetical protein n=1 Tax=Maritimibacter sp. HL-12 TaxID=1162418 RepID=UPI000A0F0E69|nr:hypothetical protein [Maritimibacter sp. HL-12]SMH47158.1 hypothetical protein SAMN05661107_1809 [Maritimibacter sp. HL-12]
MKRFFPKTFARTAIVTALSASLAFSPITATPAHAGEKEIGAIAAASFFALMTAGIIASAAKESNGKVVINRHGPKPGKPGHRRGPNRADPRKALPSQCEFTVHRGPDRGTYHGRHCLVKNFDHWAFLPDRCEEKVWVPRRGRNVNAYNAQCLSRFGYREVGQRGPRTSRN